MSRIGNLPIIVPKEITVAVNSGSVEVKGPRGTVSYDIPYGIGVEYANGEMHIVNKRSDKAGKALHGFVRAHLANEITGVLTGFTKILELQGVGYRAALNGSNLVLTVGFSHPVVITPPPGITFAIQEGKIHVSGNSKHLVGQIAANIREVRKPEPYKGKGIRYQGEYVRKKAGKAAKAVGGAAK